MPASPATTPHLGLPRFASDASSRIWDHLNAITDKLDRQWGAWSTYTPVWSQSNGSVLHVGSGSLTGRYSQQGKTVFAQVRLERASDSNVGSGNWIFTLPPIQPRSWNMVGGGFAMARNGSWFGGAVFPVSNTAFGAIAGDLGRISNNIPVTQHAAGDWYSFQLVYEAA